MDKLCEYCKQPVKKRTDRTVRFCSIACANKSRRKNFPKPCQHCGQTFQPPRSHPKQKYCSLACRDAARSERVTLPCDYCGKPSVHKKNRAERLEHHFCNRDCMLAWLHKNAPSGADHPQYSRVTVTCDTCGVELERCPSHLSTHNFCGVECRLQWQRTSGYIAGENSPTWNGGYEDYRGPNWNEQRQKALDRDRHTCQDCGSADDLQVHHIVPFSTFEDYETANQLSNLKTLCKSCHTTADWAYRSAHPNDDRVQPDTTLRKVCTHCGQEFTAQGHRAKYCPACWTRTCPTCGKQFRATHWAQKYCSRQCAGTSK